MAFDFPASTLLLSLSLLVHSHINCDAHLQKRFQRFQIKKIIFDTGQTNNWLGILVLLFIMNSLIDVVWLVKFEVGLFDSHDIHLPIYNSEVNL